MNEKNYLTYEAPVVEVYEVCVEQGFAVSGISRSSIEDFDYCEEQGW